MKKQFDYIILLAGGESNRFWPLGDKNLISIGNESLIQRQVKEYVDYCGELIVVSNAGNYDSLVEQVSMLDLPKKITFVVQEKHGQSEGILAAGKLGIKGKTLIVNNNDIVDIDYAINRLLASSSYNLVITAYKPKTYFPGGYLIIKDNRVDGIIEKPDPDKLPSLYVKIDVNYFLKIEEFLAVLREATSQKDDIFEVAISIFAKKYRVGFIKYEKEWIAIKYPWHLLHYMNYELHRKKTSNNVKNSFIDPTAMIKGNVRIGKNVKIMEYAKINGPSYIGDNAVIGNYALVTESHIGKNSVIGGYSEVTRSYIGSGVMLHRNYIGDSAVMNDVLFGAGAVTANMRLDKQTIQSVVKGIKIDSHQVKLGAMIGRSAKIGVNASLMPGVQVGGGKIVMPGEVVYKDKM